MTKKKQQKKVETQKQDRRNFLKVAAASLVPVFLRSQNSDTNKWDFLNAESKADSIKDVEQVYSDGVPLESEGDAAYNFQVADIQRNMESEGIMQEMRKKGINATIRLTKQTFGIPDARYGKQMGAYCRTAERYINQKIRLITPISLDWVVLASGDNFENDDTNKGFVGNCYCQLYHATAGELGNPARSVDRKVFLAKNGGLTSTSTEKDKFISGFVFIGTTACALTSPFSELLALHSEDQFNAHSAKSASSIGMQTNEAWHEGLAFILSYKLAAELGIPGGPEYVMKTVRNLVQLGREYEYLGNSIRWMQKNGIQAAYDLYMRDDPQKFFDAIKKSGIK